MKIVVNREEIRVALEKLYRQPIEDFSIVPSRPSAIGLKCRSVVTLIGESGTKFANVRALRDLSVKLGHRMGLREAKWAVENWKRFLEFVDEYNRLPIGTFSEGEELGVLK